MTEELEPIGQRNGTVELIKERDAEIARLRELCSQAFQLARLHRSPAKSVAELRAAEAEVDRLRAGVREAREQLEKAVSLLSAEAEAVNDKCRELHENALSAQRQVADRDAEIARLRESLISTRVEMDHQAAAYEVGGQTLGDLRAELAVAKREVEGYKNSTRILELHRSRYEPALAESQRKLAEAQARISELDRADRHSCDRALRALAKHKLVTPLAGFGSNTCRAISDLIAGLYVVAEQKKELEEKLVEAQSGYAITQGGV